MSAGTLQRTAETLQRTRLLVGDEAMDRLAATRVILFGVGGVGSWCAEALVRTGVGHLTIVDFDDVALSNVNRQLPATTRTVGRKKVDVMRERLLAINPEADIRALARRYTPQDAGQFALADHDYVIDAIDSVPDKAHLLLTASATEGVTVFAAMGAARKTDIRRIEVAEFWKVRGCPLARALRNHFKATGQRPARPVRCVYSEERADNLGSCEDSTHNGTLAHAVGAFGLMLAQLVIDDVRSRAKLGADDPKKCNERSEIMQ